MIKKAIIAVVVILAAAAIVFAAENTAPNNSASNSNQEIQQNSANNANNGSTSNNNDAQTKISAAEAKKIAEKYIEEPGASAGTPKLSKQDGNLVYTVPVIMNGKNVGEIDIDAQTGENLGGAGGAP